MTRHERREVEGVKRELEKWRLKASCKRVQRVRIQERQERRGEASGKGKDARDKMQEATCQGI
jgi:hypothetical protein